MTKLFDFEGWEVHAESKDIDYLRDSGVDKTEFFWCHDPAHPEIDRIACWGFAPFPMNCGIVVSIQTYLAPKVRGQGLSNKLHRIKEKVAKDLGYSAMICTVAGSNTPEIVGAEKNGWRFRFGFGNRRMGTYNLIGVKFL